MAYERTSGGGYVNNPLSTVNNTQKKKEQNQKSSGQDTNYNNAAKQAADEAAWAAAQEEKRRQERAEDEANAKAKAQAKAQAQAKAAQAAQKTTTTTTTPVATTTTTTVSQAQREADEAAALAAKQKEIRERNAAAQAAAQAAQEKARQEAYQRAQEEAARLAAQKKAQEEAVRQAEAQRQEQLLARQRAAELERQRQAEAARQAELERARQAELQRQAEIQANKESADTALAQGESAVNTAKPTTAGYLPYGDPRANTADNPVNPNTPMSQEEWLLTPEGQAALANQEAQRANDAMLRAAAQQNLQGTNTRLAGGRYAENYPEYTGEQPMLYGQRTASADYYRGRELMQPSLNTSQQNKNAFKAGAVMSAENEDETELYNPFAYLDDVSTAGVNVDLSPVQSKGYYTPTGNVKGMYNPNTSNTHDTTASQVTNLLDIMRPDVTRDEVNLLGSSSKAGTYPYDRYGASPFDINRYVASGMSEADAIAQAQKDLQTKNSTALAEVGNALESLIRTPVGMAFLGMNPDKTFEENAAQKLRTGNSLGKIISEIGNILVPSTNSGTIGANMSQQEIWDTIYENAKRNGESDASAKITADEGTQQWLDYDATVGNEKYFTGEGTSTTGSTTKPGTNIPDSYSDLRTEAGRRAKDMGLENGTEEYKEFVNDYMNTHTYVGDPRTGVKYDSNDNPFYNTGGSTGNTSNSKATDKENRDALANADNPTATFIRERNAFEEQYKDSDKYKTDAERRAAAEQAAYDKIYDDYVAEHKDAIGEQNARSQAYQKIYDIGYRPDFNDPNKAYLKYITGMTDNENHMNATEKAIKNDYWTNEASDPLREFNMIAGHFDRSEGEDRLFYDITSELAGNAFANQYEWTGQAKGDKSAAEDTKGKWVERKTPGTFATTPGFEDKEDWVDTDVNNPLNQNSALQAGLGDLLSADQLLHFYDANYSDLVIPPETQRWLASDSTHAIQELVLNGGKNLDRLQKEHGTKDEFNEALRALIEANPGLKMLVDNNKVSTSQVENNFFKAIIDDNGNVTNPFTSGNGTSNSPHPGYYEWRGQLYPIDQEKAKYYLKNGTYDGWEEGMRDYYNTFGTFYGYSPTWKDTGKATYVKANESRGDNYKSYTGGNYSGGTNTRNSSYGGNNYYYNGSSGAYANKTERGTTSPSTSNKKENRIYNIMKNWSF